MLAQRLFWGRLHCGTKSKELDLGSPAAGLGTQTAFDFYPPQNFGGKARCFCRRLIPKILEFRSQKPFNRISFDSYSWDTAIEAVPKFSRNIRVLMMAIKKDNPIGMFDSGLGGVSCLGQGVHMLPYERFVYFGDSGVEPYALLPKAEVKQHCFKACDVLVEKGAKAIVVACNTATSVAIADLRKRYDIPVLGTEPAIKPAVSFGLTGKIVVMATGMTLQSKMMDTLIDRFGAGCDFVKLPCRKIITLVESGIIDGSEIERSIQTCFRELDPGAISSVVIGCTHFGFLEKSLKKVLGDHIRFADPNEGIIRHLKKILEQENLLNDSEINTSPVEIYNSGGDGYVENAKKMLDKHVLNLKEAHNPDKPEPKMTKY